MSDEFGVGNMGTVKRSLSFGCVAFLSMLSGTVCAAPALTIEQIGREMSKARERLGSLTGIAKITKEYVGVPAPDTSYYAAAGTATEGQYRWYVRQGSWWLVKEVAVPPRFNRMSGTNRYIERDDKGRVLRYTDFQRDSGEHFFLSGHLDPYSERSDGSLLAGRSWNGSPFSEILPAIEHVHQRQSEAGIEFEGTYRGDPIRLVVAPQYGYLVTEVAQSPGQDRYGYRITKVRQVGKDWLPEVVEAFNGVYEKGHLTTGSIGHVVLTGFKPHGAPTWREVPTMPAGAVLGSHESRLYRVAQDGTLVDFGRQGYKPGTPLAWGDLFVLSGAGILLTSLSWLVFRKRRASPSSR